MKFFFYQNFPNQLQVDHLEALARQPGCDVTLVVEEELPAWRRNLGWSGVKHERVRVVRVTGEQTAARLVRECPADAVRVFSGVGAYSAVSSAFREACRVGGTLGIMAEPGIGLGVMGRARALREKFRARRHRRKVSFLLAIGGMGVDWYRAAGYDQAQVVPYAYFVAGPDGTEPETAPQPEGPFRIVFIGQLVRRKGIDILFDALQRISKTDWRIDIVGSGPMRQVVEGAVARLGPDRALFHGALPHRDAVELIARSDALVLPSRWDGWGAVVNEALLRGTRVVCSDHCGASVLLGSSERGRVFEAGSVDSLVDALAAMVAEGRPSREARQRLRDWARCITPEAGARYLCGVVRAVRSGSQIPEPPWAQ